jgi:cytochrome c oxidase subunit 2
LADGKRWVRSCGQHVQSFARQLIARQPICFAGVEVSMAIHRARCIALNGAKDIAMKQIPASLLTMTAGILVTLVSLWVGQNHGLLPEQASVQAPLVDGLFDVMVTIATALFILVEGAIVYFVIQYRRRDGDNEDGVPLEGNLPLEAFWTAIPAIIVIGLGVYSVDVFQQMGGFNPGGHHGASGQAVAQVAHVPHDEIAGDVAPLLADMDMDRSEGTQVSERVYGFGSETDRAADVVIDVTGMQFAWLFNYPDDGIITGELHIPANRDVQLNISAQDVIHSFWVPQFRLKQDAIPGEKTELRFIANRPGTYPVICAELCGSYHGGMRAEVIVHEEDEFDQWLAENRRVADATVDNPAMDSGAIATLPAGLAAKILGDPSQMSDEEFLAPYGEDMGINAEAIAHLHPATAVASTVE